MLAKGKRTTLDVKQLSRSRIVGSENENKDSNYINQISLQLLNLQMITRRSFKDHCAEAGLVGF